MKTATKVGILLAVLAMIIMASYFYISNNVMKPTSQLDQQTETEQEKELLTNQAYQNLPEVIALKKELAAEKQGQKVTKQGSKPATESQAAIENQLQTKLQQMQGEYNGRLSGLIAAAKAEYQQIKAGQSKASVGSLPGKYMGQAEALEAECDARVYATILTAKSQLAAQGYDTSIAEKARTEYQRAKAARKQALINKVLKH